MIDYKDNGFALPFSSRNKIPTINETVNKYYTITFAEENVTGTCANVFLRLCAAILH